MPRELTKKKRTHILISWALVAICMGIIFWLSGRTAYESSKQSGAILKWLLEHFGDNIFTDFIVRKLAHCLEFTGLAFLFNIAWNCTRDKQSPLLSIACTSIYAATDEFHQLFVDGRSCEFRDWVIDSSGAIIGTIATIIIFQIILAIRKKKKAIDTPNNWFII